MLELHQVPPLHRRKCDCCVDSSQKLLSTEPQLVYKEIRSVKDKPFYCQSSVGTIPFQGRVFFYCCPSAATFAPYGNGDDDDDDDDEYQDPTPLSIMNIVEWPGKVLTT